MAGGAEAVERALERGARAKPSGLLTEATDYSAVEVRLGDGPQFVQPVEHIPYGLFLKVLA